MNARRNKPREQREHSAESSDVRKKDGVDVNGDEGSGDATEQRRGRRKGGR